MRSFKIKNGYVTIKSPEAGIDSFGKKFDLEVKNGKLVLPVEKETQNTKCIEIRDALLQAGYTWN